MLERVRARALEGRDEWAGVRDSLTRTVVVVPTFNERENIARLVHAVLEHDEELSVLVVDDNSPDGTAAVVEGIAQTNGRVALVRRPQREGIGPAYKAGFAHALHAGAERIVQMDADFSHPIALLTDLLAQLGEYDVVLGSRYLNGGAAGHADADPRRDRRVQVLAT